MSVGRGGGEYGEGGRGGGEYREGRKKGGGEHGEGGRGGMGGECGGGREVRRKGGR